MTALHKEELWQGIKQFIHSFFLHLEIKYFTKDDQQDTQFVDTNNLGSVLAEQNSCWVDGHHVPVGKSYSLLHCKCCGFLLFRHSCFVPCLPWTEILPLTLLAVNLKNCSVLAFVLNVFKSQQALLLCSKIKVSNKMQVFLRFSKSSYRHLALTRAQLCCSTPLQIPP